MGYKMQMSNSSFDSEMSAIKWEKCEMGVQLKVELLKGAQLDIQSTSSFIFICYKENVLVHIPCEPECFICPSLIDVM